MGAIVKKIILLPLIYFSIYLNSTALFVYANQNIKLSKLNSEKKYDNYILGPGDELFIEFEGLELFSNNYIINPEGELTLPELNKVYVKGETLISLEASLKKKYEKFIINPKLNINISKYRSVSIFLNGEVNRPGLYSLNYITTNNSFIVPKLFDAIKQGEGITNNADLSNVVLIRDNPISKGGGKLQTRLDFLALIKKGDQSQNIRLMDGDYIEIKKSDEPIQDQLLEITRSNLTPNQITVFVNGNVFQPGMTRLPTGSSLQEALASVGGKYPLSGQIKFIRFNRDGKTEKKIIAYNSEAKKNTPQNPLLLDRDIIIVKKNLLGKTTSILTEFSAPVLTGYGLYSIFND